MYSAAAVRRCLVGSVACAFCLGAIQSAPTQAVSIEKELLFAEGVEARGQPDLAAKHLESILDGGPFAGRDEARLRHALAETCRKIAFSPGPTRKRAEYLQKARDNYQRVLKLDPTADYADEARFSLGIVYKALARLGKRDWEKLRDELARLGEPRVAENLAPGGERAKRRREAQQLVGEARDEVGRLLQVAVECLSRAAGDREREVRRLRVQMGEEGRAGALAELDERIQENELPMALAHYEWYEALVLLGEVLGPDSPEGQKHLQTAASRLRELSREFDRWLISRHATVAGGHAHCLMKAYGLGFKRYGEVISEADGDALDEVVQRAYYRFAGSVLHADPEHYPKNLPPQHPLATYLLEGLDYTVTREDVREGIGLKEIAERFGRDPHVVMKLNEKTMLMVRAGEKLCIYRGLFRRFAGIDAEPLGKAARLLLAEAHVDWGRELKERGRPLKAWMAKVRAGIRHAEWVAEGDDVWARKAGSLLAGWTGVMVEIGYVSPVQAYAGAVASFLRARKAKAQTEKCRLYDDAIRGFQEVIRASAGQAAGTEQLLDGRKLVDSWYMMGCCYRETGREQGAALCWNACARAFPTDAKAERIGHQSASILSSLYREAPEESRKAVGHFYEEMLGDFIDLFPGSELASAARYNYARVAWDRGEYEEAARRCKQVSPEGPCYASALYLLGLCHLNQSRGLAKDGRGGEARACLLRADDALKKLITWVDEEEAPDEESLAKRKSLQARAVLERAKIHIDPGFSDYDGALELTDSYPEKYAPVLTESARKLLFPEVFFTRIRAYVVKTDLESALEELTRLEACPESVFLSSGLEHVAVAHFNAARAKERTCQRRKERLKQREAKWEQLKREGKDIEAASMEKIVRHLRDGIAILEDEVLRLRLIAAELYYQLITRAPEQSPSVYRFAAQIHFAAGDYGKASAVYTGFLKRLGSDPVQSDQALEARARLAQSLQHLRRFADALPHFLAVDEACRASDGPKARYLRLAIKPLMNHCHKALGLELLRDPARREEALAHLSEALSGWAMLQKLLQTGTDGWWEARYESLDILYVKGDHGPCLRHLAATKLMYPGMGGNQWRPKFLDLAKRLKGKLTKRADLQKIERIISGLAR